MQKTESRNFLVLILAGLLAGMPAGCRTPPSPISDEDATPPFEMRLMPGDEVEISFFGAPELNILQRIRRDGRIALRLSDEIEAAGKTVSELNREMVARYKGQIQIQSITVVMRTGPSVVVSGAVMAPGRVEIARPMTALDAVMAVGGFNPERAQLQNVVVIRHEGQNYKGYRLDLRAAMKGESGRAFYVRPNDIVHVPERRIVALNRWVDQYINRMLPKLGVGYSSEGEVTVYR